MGSIGIGLQLTIFGMGLVFLLLGVMALMIKLLLRTDSAPPAAEEKPPPALSAETDVVPGDCAPDAAGPAGDFPQPVSTDQEIFAECLFAAKPDEHVRQFKVEAKGEQYVASVQKISTGRFRVVLDDQVTEVQVLADQGFAQSRIAPETIRVGPAISRTPPCPDVSPPPSPAMPPKPRLSSSEVCEGVTSPMPGVINSVNVKPGDKVKRGDTLVVLEAMKMNNSIGSPRDGTIEAVLVQAGQCVGHGDLLVKFAKEDRP